MSEPNFEDNVKRMEEIVAKMEEGGLNLQDSIALFKEGTELTKQCQEQLTKTELLIQKVIDQSGKIEVDNC
ncbi:MAG: exodeoxyribonuclease VII small subunit [archaeon]|nr:exodeoxyribonuclease VII small subunit [Nanoarchaeota archaeon]